MCPCNDADSQCACACIAAAAAAPETLQQHTNQAGLLDARESSLQQLMHSFLAVPANERMTGCRRGVLVSEFPTHVGWPNSKPLSDLLCTFKAQTALPVWRS